MVNGGNKEMRIKTMNPILIRRLGLEALTKALGPVGMARFFQQYEGGTGDYTKERKKWLKGLSIEDIISEIKDNRRQRKSKKS